MRVIPIILIPFLLLSLNLNAEKESSEGAPFGKASIEGIEDPGYYRLLVPPKLQKHCRLDLKDLRILRSGSEQEVPYLLKGPGTFDPFIEQRELEILDRNSLKKGGTVVILEDTAQKSIQALSLEVDQGTVSRSIRIMASEDQENWKEVHAGQRYHDERYPDGTRRFVLRELELEPHRFYRIHLGAEGRGLDPRILEAKVIRVKKGWEHYDPIPVKEQEVISKDGRTYIRPIFDAPSYRIDGFDLKLGDSDHVYRSGFLARGDPQSPDSLKRLEAFDIVSHGESELRFKGFRSNDLLIVLKDGDLPPLSIKGVKAYQRERSIIFRVKEGSEHSLSFGDRDADAPNYDLPHFREQMPDSLMKASVGKIRWNGPPLEEWVKEAEGSEKDDGYRILTTIGIVLIWLFGVSVFVSIGILIYRKAL